MIALRTAIALLCLTGCSAVGATRAVTHEESTISQAGNTLGDASGVPGTTEIDVVNSAPAAAGADPTTEHVVACAALIAGAIVFTGLIIVVYKVGKILRH